MATIRSCDRCGFVDTCNGADEHGAVIQRRIFEVPRDLCYRCAADLKLAIAAFMRGKILFYHPSRPGKP